MRIRNRFTKAVVEADNLNEEPAYFYMRQEFGEGENPYQCKFPKNIGWMIDGEVICQRPEQEETNRLNNEFRRTPEYQLGKKMKEKEVRSKVASLLSQYLIGETFDTSLGAKIEAMGKVIASAKGRESYEIARGGYCKVCVHC